MAPDFHGADALRAVVSRFGVESLTIDDLRSSDPERIAWSGTPAHVRNVAAQLERVECGEVEYLAVRLPDGTPIAKGGLDYQAVPGAATIWQLATHQDVQGMGIGTRLIAAAEARIRARGLVKATMSVESGNHRARALYLRLGYVSRGGHSASWEAVRGDGSTPDYSATSLIEMEKDL